MAVDKFNEHFKENEFNLQLKRNFSNYEFRPSKKTGLPKLDLPPISNDVIVRDTFITQFSLMCKSEDLVFVKSEKTSVCNRCMIL